MAKHVLIIEDEKGRWLEVLENLVYSVGSDSSCNIQIKHPSISPHHASLIQLERNGGTIFQIVDVNPKGLASANGLTVGGKRALTHELQNRDRVKLAPDVCLIYYLYSYPVFDWGTEDPLGGGSGYPRTPLPIAPTTGAEAVPDRGLNQVP